MEFVEKMTRFTAALGLCSQIFLFVGSATFAQNISEPNSDTAGAASPQLEIADWRGPYAGLLLSSTSFDMAPTDGSGGPVPSPDMSLDGALFGGIVGYNWQADNLVFGIEADIRGGTPDDTLITGFFDPIEHDRSYSIGARIGYATGNALPYAKVAWVRSKFTSDLRSGDGALLEDRTSFSTDGYALGVGVEWMLNADWTVRLEYLSHHYDDATINHEFGDGTPFQSTTPVDADSITLMGSYRF